MTVTISLYPPNPPLPAVDDHVVPEGARWELLDGERLMTPPAGEPHATQHVRLSYVLSAHVAEGFAVAIDMLTRASEDTDFAPDASIYPAARDPETGGRQLEALAFEIVSQQSMAVTTRKAIALLQRGVRRVFAIKLRKRSQTLLEFDSDACAWIILAPDTSITDPTLALPIHVNDLLRAASADGAVARALLAREVPEIMAPIQEQRRRAEHAEQRADEERANAEAERQRREVAEASAEAERQRADTAETRAEVERQRAEAEREQREAAEARSEQVEQERDAMAAELANLKALLGQKPTD